MPGGDSEFLNAPIFNFNDGKLKFDTNKVDNANQNYGSSSGFVPNSLFTQAASSDAACYRGPAERIQPPS